MATIMFWNYPSNATTIIVCSIALGYGLEIIIAVMVTQAQHGGSVEKDVGAILCDLP